MRCTLFAFSLLLSTLNATIPFPSNYVFASNTASPPSVVKDTTSASQALLDKAKTQFELQQLDEALNTLSSLIARNPRPPILQEAYFLQAAILRTRNQEKNAASILEQLLDEFPTSSLANESRLLLGQVYLATQEPKRAETVFRQLLDFSSDLDLRREALRQLREVYIMQDNRLAAITSAIEELALADQYQRAEVQESIQALILETMDKDSLKTLIETYPSRYPGDLATIRLIELHTAHGDEVLAERDIRDFLKHFPDHPYAQTAMALLQSFMHKIKINAYVIAAFLPFSGPAKTFGTDSLNGIRLALDDAKQQFDLASVGLVVKDTANTISPLRYELAQVMNDFAPVAAIGPLLSREIQSIAHVANDYEVPILTPSATLSDVRTFGQYWFSTALTASLQVHQLVEYAMTQLGHSRFCIIYPETAYGREMSRLFTDTVEYFNGEIITTETYNEQETDVAKQIIRLKDTDLALYGMMEEELLPEDKTKMVYTPGFDAVFVPGKPVNLALISSQLAFYDINVPLLGGSSWHNPELFRWARHGIEQGVFTDGIFLESPDPGIQDFIQRYRTKFQSEPSLFSVQAYDATWLILDTIRKGAMSGPEIREQFIRRHDLPTLDGFASFASTGILNRKIYILQVKNRKFVQVN